MIFKWLVLGPGVAGGLTRTLGTELPRINLRIQPSSSFDAKNCSTPANVFVVDLDFCGGALGVLGWFLRLIFFFDSTAAR